MSDQNPIRVLARGNRGKPGNRWLMIAIAAVLVLAVGVLIGRATAPGGSAPGVPIQDANPGPTRLVSGVPVGYAHSQEGAVAAALNYGEVSSQEGFLNLARRKVILGLIATPAFAREYERKATPGIATALRGPLGQGLRAGVPTIYESAPLAYRVVSYTPERAVVVGWGMALSGNTNDLTPQADFQTSTSTVVWSGGDWKASSGNAVEGPTPALAEQSKPTPPAQLIQDLQSLRTVHYAP